MADMDIWCEPDTDETEAGWLDIQRLQDPDSVERLELWLQVMNRSGGNG